MNRSEETDDQIESQQLMDEEEFVDAELGQPRGGAPTHGQTPMQFQLTLFAHCFYIIMCMCSFTVVLPSMWAYIIHLQDPSVILLYGFVCAAWPLGRIVGIPIFRLIAGKRSMKEALLLSLLVILVGSIVYAFSPNAVAVFFARLVTGLGAGRESVCSLAYEGWAVLVAFSPLGNIGVAPAMFVLGLCVDSGLLVIFFVKRERFSVQEEQKSFWQNFSPVGGIRIHVALFVILTYVLRVVSAMTLTVVPYVYYRFLVGFDLTQIAFSTALLYLVYALIGLATLLVLRLLRRFTRIAENVWLGFGTLLTWIGCMCMIPYTGADPSVYYWPMVVGSVMVCAVGDRICESLFESSFRRISDSNMIQATHTVAFISGAILGGLSMSADFAQGMKGLYGVAALTIPLIGIALVFFFRRAPPASGA